MILILPGLGANSLMYPAPWRDLPDTVFMDWPTDHVPQSIPDLARRMAKGVEQPVDHIVGSSLGGMVGLEMAEYLNADTVTLIGSAVTGHEVYGFFRRLHPLTALAPIKACQKVARQLDWSLARMFAEQNPDFIRAMLRAIPHWTYSGAAPSTDIYRIHGRYDPIIQCDHADLWLEGGHVLAMTHANECVAALIKLYHA
ncbi:MAG: alpha/beta fold hydrolase [Planctomycetota bacterium]|jgi:pimeloyl-ACP methyl ester carboxylesterase